MAMLFSYPNVWNTCLLILQERGYRLYLTGDPDEVGTISRCAWNAEKNGVKLRGDNPIELLGLVGIYEYHQPQKDVPYWWRIEGDNVIAEMEAEWRRLPPEADAPPERGGT
jgi:hypothetical protein